MWIHSQLAYLICPAREIFECQLLDVHPGPQQWGYISPKFSFPKYTYQKNLIIKSIPGGGENKTSDTQDSTGNIALRANFISNHVRVSFGILTWMLFPAFPERFWFLLYNSLICFSSVLTFFFFSLPAVRWKVKALWVTTFQTWERFYSQSTSFGALNRSFISWKNAPPRG